MQIRDGYREWISEPTLNRLGWHYSNYNGGGR